MKKHILSAVALLMAFAVQARVDYKVIPMPQTITLDASAAVQKLAPGMLVSYPGDDDQMRRNAQFAQEYFGLVPQIADKKKSTPVALQLGLQSENPDAYEIRVDKKGIVIRGASVSGVFYGLQTLRKSVATEQGDTYELPYATVCGAPRFQYRGCMLDCARFFFTVDEVKQYIDILALHGVNKFHWHLTDDQGWRFEVKALPQLAIRASYRSHTIMGHNLQAGGSNAIYDNVPVSGYYTQDQLRDIVRYAQERYITIIPEIDLPGHMMAALSVYPELGCTGGPYKVLDIWGVSDDVLCAGNPQVLDFLRTVYGELCDIFPSEYIHIGGDESPRKRWEKCPKCQAKMKELGLKKEAELQTYINKEMDRFLASRGRKLIGWDETLEGGLSENGIVMSWRGFEGGIEAARQGHQVIMTPTRHCYIDYHQLSAPMAVPAVVYAMLPLSRVYELEPIPAELTEEEGKLIIGTQCNLWTERVNSNDVLQFQLLPRLAAIAEVQWVDKGTKEPFDAFTKRMVDLEQLYLKLGYKYCARWE